MSSKNSFIRELFTGLIGPIVVGVVVLVGQSIVQPIIAKGVKKEETKNNRDRNRFLFSILTCQTPKAY